MTKYLDILRSIVYSWVVYETIFLAFLYKMAWSNMKRSPIIFSLHLIFLSLGLFFTLATISAFLRAVDMAVANRVLYFMMIPAIGLGLSMRLFRRNSLDQELTDKLKKKNV